MAELHPLLTQSVGFRPCQDADHKIVARSFLPPSGITHLSHKAGGRGRALARVCQAVRPIRVALVDHRVRQIGPNVPLWGILGMQSHLGRMSGAGDHAIDELISKARAQEPTRLPTLAWYPQIPPIRKYKKPGAGWWSGRGHRMMRSV